ncbi:MAG: hypothetical protein WCF20_02050 [Methylovirgula sp.]
MASENIERFNVGALRAVAFLYKALPNTVTVDHSTLLRSTESSDGSVMVELSSGGEHGTILWLYKNGFVDGNLIESKPLQGDQKAAIMSAQLSSKALRILQRPEQNAGGVPLGEYAVASAFGERESVAAELVMRRLLGS